MIHSKTTLTRRLVQAATALGLGLALPVGAALFTAAGTLAAQSPFSAAARINDSIVTWYEVDQRARFLEIVRTPGDLREAALEALVNERLQVQEARRMGVTATPEEIEEGVAEFAARADLGPEQFLRNIGQEGVAPETFRDFVANGISWRNVVQTRFGQRVRGTINEADVDEAAALRAASRSARILLCRDRWWPSPPRTRKRLRDDLTRLNG